MWCQHLLLFRQIEQLLRPTKGFIEELGSDSMIDDINKSNAPACFGEVLSDFFLFFW